MAAVGLIDLKRRIKSVVNTQKITRAMGLVATVKFKTARIKFEMYKPYYEQLSKSVNKLSSVPDIAGSAEEDNKKDLYIVITSDSGLCGSYNVNVINTVLNETKGRENDVLLITVGQKGKNFFESRGYEIAANFTGMNPNSDFKEVSRIIKKGMDYFEDGSVKGIYVIYTKFYSPAKQLVETVKLFPLEQRVKDNQEYILFEPSKDGMYDYIVPRYLCAAMYNTAINSITSEFAMRMNSMDSATKNASDILSKLRTVYNRARQGSITQEITEIVSGAEALKG